MVAERTDNAVIITDADGIITIDTRGLVQPFNPAAERLFGYAADEVVGHNVELLMPEPYSREHDGYIAHYQDTGEARVIGIGREVEGRRRDGGIFPMELVVSEMAVNNDRMFTGIVRDISERKQAEQRLYSVTAMRKAI